MNKREATGREAASKSERSLDGPNSGHKLQRWWTRLRTGARHAFALGNGDSSLSEEERRMLDKVASLIVRRQMAEPALLVLESVRPLHFLGSQVLIFLRPLVEGFVSHSQWDLLSSALEKRASVEVLLDAIERHMRAQRTTSANNNTEKSHEPV